MSDEEMSVILEKEAREHLEAMAANQSKWVLGEYEFLEDTGYLYMQRLPDIRNGRVIDHSDIQFWLNEISFDRASGKIYQYEPSMEF
jgi:hypothetical protein